MFESLICKDAKDHDKMTEHNQLGEHTGSPLQTFRPDQMAEHTGSPVFTAVQRFLEK